MKDVSAMFPACSTDTGSPVGPQSRKSFVFLAQAVPVSLTSETDVTYHLFLPSDLIFTSSSLLQCLQCLCSLPVSSVCTAP